MIAFTIVAWPLLALSVAGLVYWIAVIVRAGRVLADRPTVRRGLELAGLEAGWPKLSIIVPVHNEQRVIDACATSLRQQDYQSVELVFVLDRCTDDTERLLTRHAEADPRIVMVRTEACPDDWAGKCHAAHLGAERATGQWLLFTDADTRFEPALARAALLLAMDRQMHLLSLLTTLTVDHRFEWAAQSVATMNLIRMYPLQGVNRDERARPFANGQFMLFRRDWYERIGGHAAVRDALLEDLAFARLLKENGGRGTVVLADGMLICSMYASLEAFKSGWKRIFIEACKRKPGRLRKKGWRVLANGVGLPLVQVATVAAGAVLLMTGAAAIGLVMIGVAAVGWLAQIVALRWIYASGGAPKRAAVLYPAGCWIVGRIMLDAARDLKKRRPVIWGGRQYVLEPR
jgi:chlorobactene glucosyltransferase